jgi:hypothetical protein
VGIAEPSTPSKLRTLREAPWSARNDDFEIEGLKRWFATPLKGCREIAQ